MPSVSRAQNGFMALSKTPRGREILRRAGKKPAPAKVADEYLQADKGRKVGALPGHVGHK